MYDVSRRDLGQQSVDLDQSESAQDDSVALVVPRH